MRRPGIIQKLKTFADRSWYAPLVGLLAGLDQFIVVIPIEWLLIPGVLVRPKRWLSSALWVTTGCALGALLLAGVAENYGPDLLTQWAPSVVHSKGWVQATGFLDEHGALSVFLIAVSPFPQQPIVALAGLAKISLPKVFLAVWMGRAIKYCLVAWLASHAPNLLSRLPGAKKQGIQNNEI
jgi:membrane protein YqaA with SNARE-associated domain